jgi:cobaltochelatase CobN
MYETLTEKYVLDEDVADFMRRSNPWALRAISERLLEAAERGLWEQPEPATLGALRGAYLAADGELEEAAT